MKEHILTLNEPYRSAALKSITILCEPRLKTKFKTLHSALAWALPAGELKRNPFWVGALEPTPERKVLKGKPYTKIDTINKWVPVPGEDVEASTDGRLWAKRTFVSNNPTDIGGKYVIIDKYGRLQSCQLLRKSRPSPFNRHG